MVTEMQSQYEICFERLFKEFRSNSFQPRWRRLVANVGDECILLHPESDAMSRAVADVDGDLSLEDVRHFVHGVLCVQVCLQLSE